MAEGPRDARSLIAAALAGPDASGIATSGGPQAAGRDGTATDGAVPPASAPAAPGPGPGVGTVPASAAAAAGLDHEADAALVDLYFAAETPAERDVVFERLAGRQTPTVHAFLLAMLAHEQDDALQLAAAVALAGRQEARGIAHLEAVLAAPASGADFEAAVAALAPHRGPALYGWLHACWQEDGQPEAGRLAAMRALTLVDEARALADFTAFIAAQAERPDPRAIADDQLEAALVACLAAEHVAAEGPMRALRARLAAWPWPAAAAAMGRELVDTLDEALALLSA